MEGWEGPGRSGVSMTVVVFTFAEEHCQPELITVYPRGKRRS